MSAKDPLNGKPEVERSWCQRTFSPMMPGSIRGSIFTFCSGTMGSGILSLPFAVGTCGLVTGIVLLIGIGVSFFIFFSTIAYACEKTQKFSYVGVLEAGYGECGRRLAEGSVIILLFGVISSLQAIVCSFALFILKSLGVLEDIDDPANRLIFLVIMNLVIFFPLGISKQVNALRYASLISVLCIIYIIVVVVVYSPFYIDTYLEAEKITHFNWEPTALDAAGIIFFGFDNAMTVPMIFEELKGRSLRRIRKVLNRAFMLLVLVYTLLGVLGYLSYIGNIPELVVFRPPLYEGFYDWTMEVGRIVIICTMSVQIPVLLQPLRQAAEQFVGGSDYKRNQAFFYASTVLFLGLPMLIATFVPQIVAYFKFLGGIFSVLCGIVFPTMMLYSVSTNFWARSGLTILAAVLCALGLACVGRMFSDL